MLASLAPTVISAAVALLPHPAHHVVHRPAPVPPPAVVVPAPVRQTPAPTGPITAESPPCDDPGASPGACVVVQLPSERDGRELG